MREFVLDGYVTRNVSERAARNGRSVTSFSVNSPDYDRETGQSKPQFFDCEFWHDQADRKHLLIREGALLLLWGRLGQDAWQDRQTGQNRSKVTLRVLEVAQIREPQPRQAAPAPAQGYQPAPAPAPQQAPQAPAPAPQPYRQAPAQQAPQAPAPAPDLYDEDIPF